MEETRLAAKKETPESDACRAAAAYQWGITGLAALLTFVLGVQCQGERLSATVIKSEARITAAENSIRELRDGINWLTNNVATKADIERMTK